MIEPKDKYSCLDDNERKFSDLQRKSVEVITDLLLSCDSLMGEVTGRSITNWQLINDSLIKANVFLKSIINK